MKTVTIQIGNSDDKLTQGNWARYVDAVHSAISNSGCSVHFFGGSPNWYPWQNVAWVLEAGDDKDLQALKDCLFFVRKKFGQDSVAWTESETLFV